MNSTFLSKATLTATILTCFTQVVHAQKQSPPPTISLSEPLRATLYPEVMCAGCIVPEWDGRYLLHKEIDKDPAVVTMYDENGNKVLTARISRSDFYSIFANAIAVTHAGGILAGASGDKTDGTRQSFLAMTDPAGRTTQSVLTSGFQHHRVCEAPDGSVWTLGFPWASGDSPDAQHILRHYSWEKGLVGSFISIDSMAKSTGISEIVTPRDSYLHCGKDRVAVYLAPSAQYIEVNASDKVSRWKVDMSSVIGDEPRGFAVTDDQSIFVAFTNSGGSKRSKGLYALIAVPGNPIATLTPVKGTVNARDANIDLPEGAFRRLWGADGNSLVVSREGDGWGISWVKVISSHITPD